MDRRVGRGKEVSGGMAGVDWMDICLRFLAEPRNDKEVGITGKGEGVQ